MMQSRHPYSIVFPLLLVLGMWLAWVSASVDIHTVSAMSFSCEELEEDLRKGFSMVLPDNVPIIETSAMYFVLLPCAIESPDSDGSSGWVMPLRI